MGDTIQVAEPDPSGTNGGNLITTYSYDTMEHLTKVSMPRNGPTPIPS